MPVDETLRTNLLEVNCKLNQQMISIAQIQTSVRSIDAQFIDHMKETNASQRILALEDKTASIDARLSEALASIQDLQYKNSLQATYKLDKTEYKNVQKTTMDKVNNLVNDLEARFDAKLSQ